MKKPTTAAVLFTSLVCLLPPPPRGKGMQGYVSGGAGQGMGDAGRRQMVGRNALVSAPLCLGSRAGISAADSVYCVRR